jgi:diguanylate cyclase (GGDEF)-like protein
LIVLPETALSQALRVAERIRLSIEAHHFLIAGNTLAITSSFGVAGYESGPGTDLGPMNDLIAHADLCLYRSKERGRNRVTSILEPV